MPDRRTPNEPGIQRVSLEGYAVSARALGALEKTVEILQSSLTAQQQTLSGLEMAVRALNDFIFGREDPGTLKHIPGLRDRVNQDSFLMRFGLLGIAILCIHALGIPTNWLGESLLHYFGITVK